MDSQTTTYHDNTSGQKLLHSVERMLDRPEDIARIVDGYRGETSSLDRLCDRLVSHYSNRSALAGGVSALPCMIPGVGTLSVALGTTLAEMAVVLKLEVELCLALASAHGFDIGDRRERQLAMVLAAVYANEVERGRNVLLDVGGVSWAAIVNYSPRQLEKLLLHVFSAVAVVYASKYVTKGLLRSVPFLGIGIGAGLNKVLTTRVGKNARRCLALRVSA